MTRAPSRDLEARKQSHPTQTIRRHFDSYSFGGLLSFTKGSVLRRQKTESIKPLMFSVLAQLHMQPFRQFVHSTNIAREQTWGLLFAVRLALNRASNRLERRLLRQVGITVAVLRKSRTTPPNPIDAQTLTQSGFQIVNPGWIYPPVTSRSRQLKGDTSLSISWSTRLSILCHNVP